MRSLDDKRAIASLATSPGWRLLVAEVRKLQTASMERLKLTNVRDDIVASAVELRTLERVAVLLETLPPETVEELKQQGDEIYG